MTMPNQNTPILAFWALSDDLGFPAVSMTAWVPTRKYAAECPGSDDPVRLLRWLADTIERDGCQRVSIGGSE